jgi:hypothetical protein
MPPPVAAKAAPAAPAIPRPPPPRAPAAPSNGASDDKSVALRLDPVGSFSKPANGNAGYATPEEESHFREVFAKFVSLRQQCGEVTSDLTYERFLGTLQKHRDQILQSRPDAKGVRFTVYEKEGRAALKAAPRKA